MCHHIENRFCNTFRYLSKHHHHRQIFDEGPAVVVTSGFRDEEQAEYLCIYACLYIYTNTRIYIYICIHIHTYEGTAVVVTSAFKDEEQAEYIAHMIHYMLSTDQVDIYVYIYIYIYMCIHEYI
jgi:hypothetical protein